MRIKPTLASLALTWVAAAFPGASAIAGPALAIKAMPAELETRYALSALPAKLRDEAGVYLLDPDKGYTLTRSGTNGLECLVARESWDWAEFRDDIYFPLCFDAAGRSTYQRVSLDVAGLRARGMSATAVKAEIEKRYRDKTYQAPARAGLSYMVAPVMRALGPPDMKVHTMSMPHLMFYAPGLTNQDIGAQPDLADPWSLMFPFVQTEGVREQSYMIQIYGAAEKAKILSQEKRLVADLCAYRNILCLHEAAH